MEVNPTKLILKQALFYHNTKTLKWVAYISNIHFTILNWTLIFKYNTHIWNFKLEHIPKDLLMWFTKLPVAVTELTVIILSDQISFQCIKTNKAKDRTIH